MTHNFLTMHYIHLFFLIYFRIIWQYQTNYKYMLKTWGSASNGLLKPFVGRFLENLLNRKEDNHPSAYKADTNPLRALPPLTSLLRTPRDRLHSTTVTWLPAYLKLTNLFRHPTTGLGAKNRSASALNEGGKGLVWLGARIRVRADAWKWTISSRNI